MKKFFILIFIIFCCGNISAQSIIIQQNNQQPQKERIIEKEVRVPVYITPEKSEVECIYGYLYIYPEKFGAFDEYPREIVNAINSHKAYGRNSWRLPTKDELKLLEKAEKLGRPLGYMPHEGYMYVTNEGTIVDGEFDVTLYDNRPGGRPTINRLKRKLILVSTN